MKFARTTAIQWTFPTLISAFFTQGFALAADKIPADGSLKAIAAEELEEPYQRDEHYVYSKSPSFSRWVYSPWTSPSLEQGKGLVLTDIQMNERRAVLISEFHIDTSHLDNSKQYQLLLEKNYICGEGEKNPGQPCTLQFGVRCYGKTADSEWGVTFEKNTLNRVSQGEGKFTIDQTIFSLAQCQRGVYISSEATISPEISKYTFKNLQVGLLEVSPAITKR